MRPGRESAQVPSKAEAKLSGVMGAKSKEKDEIAHLFVATTHHYILFFTDKGRVYRLKAYDIPLASRQP